MKIGFHVSIAGGIALSVKRALDAGCTTMQIFSHSPRMWAFPPINPDDAKAFKEQRKASGIAPVFVHTSYLINLATTDNDLFEKSIAALKEEMRRADVLGAEYVVTHLGSSGAPPEDAVERVAGGLKAVFEGEGFNSTLLLENTACERGDAGCSFGEIGEIIAKSGLAKIGVALDTCHSYGAGYDLAHRDGIEETLSIIDGAIGLDRLRLVHLNDSKHGLGSHRDRHQNIGMGMLGEDAFRLILNHPVLRDLPFVMETPKDTPDDDKKNMATVLRLREKEKVL